ncbi:hypothetical protein BDW22DRAFT_1390641 [Trametopsis cervina]|nr:hypothetical protein BDW22DRAFT_1390641 [Trametopsis cervina]
MNLYFVPNDPEKTTLVSTNGIAQYRVVTSKAGAFKSPSVTRVNRPAETVRDTVVGEVEWRRWGFHPQVRSNVFDGVDQKIEIRELLYKVGSTFSTARFFLGNDNEEYRWKYAKGSGYVLSHRVTGEEVARFVQEVVKEGFFRGERKWGLKIRPTSLDIDVIVLTFIILEKRRRDALKNAQKQEDNEEWTCESGVEIGAA